MNHLATNPLITPRIIRCRGKIHKLALNTKIPILHHPHLRNNLPSTFLPHPRIYLACRLLFPKKTTLHPPLSKDRNHLNGLPVCLNLLIPATYLLCMRTKAILSIQGHPPVPPPILRMIINLIPSKNRRVSPRGLFRRIPLLMKIKIKKVTLKVITLMKKRTQKRTPLSPRWPSL